MDEMPARIYALVEPLLMPTPTPRHSTQTDPTVSDVPSLMPADEKKGAPGPGYVLADVLDADDPADRDATAIHLGSAKTRIDASNSHGPTDESVTGVDASDGGMANPGGTVLETTIMQTTEKRLDLARSRLGFSVRSLAKELNMDLGLVKKIMAGKVKVPANRAIRVEAKLQQWEAEITREEPRAST